MRLKGHPTLTAMFDRRTDAKAWIQKVEADIRCGKHHLYGQGRRHTFADAVYRKISHRFALYVLKACYWKDKGIV